VAAPGRIDGSTKSARLRRTVPISCTALRANAVLRLCVPCVFAVTSGGTGPAGGAIARFAFPRVGGTSTGTAYHVRFPAGHERFTAPAPCQVTALRYLFFTLPRTFHTARGAVEVKAHWARQVGMVCSFPLFGSIDLPLRNLLSETSMSALQCFYRLGQANVGLVQRVKLGDVISDATRRYCTRYLDINKKINYRIRQ